MARRPTPTLTEAEYRLMDILWDLDSATVSDVHARLEDRPIAYKPRVERDAARRTVVENVLATFFDGSPRALMLNLLDSERLSAEEERRLRTLLEDRG